MLKFWSFIYRKTGWYSPVARLAEYRYIKSEWEQIEKYYDRNKKTMHLKDVVGLWVGSWQAGHGFHRKWDGK